MSYVMFTTKIEVTQVKYLKALSEKTGIPQSRLVRDAIELLKKNKGTEMNIEKNRKIVDYIVKTDKGLLDRLAKEQD